MKKKSVDAKLVKSLRSYFKERLFSPIFYTIIFSLVIIGESTDPDVSLWGKVLVIGISVLVVSIFWFFYFRGKRIEKELKPEIDKLEVILAKDEEESIDSTSNDDLLDVEEDDHFTEEQIVKIQNQSKLFFRGQIYLIITGAVFSIVLSLREILQFSLWLSIMAFSLIGCNFIVASYLSVKAYVKLRKTVNSASKE